MSRDKKTFFVENDEKTFSWKATCSDKIAIAKILNLKFTTNKDIYAYVQHQTFKSGLSLSLRHCTKKKP